MVNYTTGANNVGCDPKVNNMLTAYKAAAYEIVWLCDDKIHGTYKNG